MNVWVDGSKDGLLDGRMHDGWLAGGVGGWVDG